MDVAASEFYDEQEKRYDLNNKEKGHPNYVNNNMKKKTELEKKELFDFLLS